MHKIISVAVLLFIGLSSFAAPAAVGDSTRLQSLVTRVRLSGPDECVQLVVTSGGQKPVDVTGVARYTVDRDGVISVSATGYVVPSGNGECTVTVSVDGAKPLLIPVTVSNFEHRRPVSFPNDVVPLLTRAGCNGGACHGTPKGKNNFRLSLLGFEPKADYEFLTRESRGRRIFPAAPERSLLLKEGKRHRSAWWRGEDSFA